MDCAKLVQTGFEITGNCSICKQKIRYENMGIESFLLVPQNRCSYTDLISSFHIIEEAYKQRFRGYGKKAKVPALACFGHFYPDLIYTTAGDVH